MYLLLALSFAFVLYYTYLLFVLYRLNQNSCQCKKINTLKKTWNFRLLSMFGPLYLIYNSWVLIKQLRKFSQNGGDPYQAIMGIIVVGYGFSFVLDYALLSLLYTMKSQNCPCQVEHRNNLEKLTYAKITGNVILLLSVLSIKKVNFNSKLEKALKDFK